jgi:hypothetical protein
VHQAKFTRLVSIVSLVSAAACLLRLDAAFAGSHNSPTTSSPSGYHTPKRTPRGKPVSSPKPPAQTDSTALLNKSLSEIRAGNLSAAVASITRLVALVPEEPRYRTLLDKTKGQLEFENWYRFQQKADPSDTAEVAAAMDEPGATPESARQKFLLWVNSVHWDKR